MSAEPILSVRGLVMEFGGIRALDKLDLTIQSGQIAALIGPNGAGKTTFFNCLTGIYTPTAGELLLSPPGQPSRRLNGLKPNRVTEAGLARTFQNIRLFPTMTVLENVMIGRHCRTRAKILGAILRDPRTLREERETVDISRSLLHKVGLADLADEKASSLAYGAQRRLEIARALATEPSFLLLDEPAAGMNPQESQDLMGFVRTIRQDFDLTILLIEHDMKVVMGICEHIWVLDYGVTIAEGAPEAIRRDPKVILAYLGEEGGLHA